MIIIAAVCATGDHLHKHIVNSVITTIKKEIENQKKCDINAQRKEE